MKKVLSVILAMLMLCSVFAVPSFAADTDPVVFPIDKDWWGTTFGSDYLCSDEQYIVSFDLNGGSLKNDTYIWDFAKNTFVYTKGSDVTGKYYMVPRTRDVMNKGQYITLPAVTPMSGQQFDGWFLEVKCGKYEANASFAANADFQLPGERGDGTSTVGTIIQFRARYSAAEQEVPTMTKVMNILFSVFGTIIAALTGESKEKVVASLKEMFGDILG